MYYNQNNYPPGPYPAPGYEKATVKSGGCGVCCGSTVLSLAGADWSPERLAPVFISRGARVSGGTNMRKASAIICELGDMACTTTGSMDKLVEHLRAGNIAIANVDGDAGAKGVFSSAGHYVVVVDIKEAGELVIYDVGDYPSKYSSAYRAERVTREGVLLVCSQETLAMDTELRNPRYYLFTLPARPEEEDKMVRYKTLEDVPAWGQATVIKLMEHGSLRGRDDQGTLDISEDMLRTLVINDREGLYDARPAEKDV